MRRLLLQAAQALLVVVLVPALVAAEVARVEITLRRDAAGGRSFGSTGAYERLAGKIYFTIDPANRRNQVIADLDKAPRNAAGKVEMSADLIIFRPRDLSRGNGVALFDIVNRGNSVALNVFSGPVTNTPEGEVGDGFLLARGFTIVQVGWEFDARGGVRIEVPGAAGVTGMVSAQFIPNNRNPVTVGDLVGYTPSDPASAKNTLRVRQRLGAQWTTIAREKWALAADNTVTLDGGFEPGQTYEVAYVAVNPPVGGLGFAAVRDTASWVRHAPDSMVSAKYLVAFGSSQTGRWLRDFVYEGFNADERNRRVFDGVMPHIGGGGAVLLNERWSTPPSLLMETATRFPFSDRKQRDPVTGAEDGLLENPRAADHQPKVFHTMSDTEYWERGGALVHTTPDGTRDIAVSDNVRIYHFASAPHNIGQFPPAMVNGETANNPFDLRIGMRALLVAMERWVRDGTAPPPSRYPRLSDGTLVRATEIAFPALRGVTSPRTAYPGVRGANARLARHGGADAPLPLIVPQVDRDGNSRGGIRLPDVAVPLATHTGWIFRNAKILGTEQFVPLNGSYVPFARTRAERAARGDPRPSTEERYQSREQYLKLVEEAAAPLVKEGYLLADDVVRIVRRAGEHWDFVTRQATTTARAE